MPGAKPYTLRYTQQHPLARLLPLRRAQMGVYRMGERVPPADLEKHGPVWEAVSFIVAGRGTLQARVNLQRDFHLISFSSQASVVTALGGFRVQLYDIKKKIRLADRGVQQANFAGPSTATSAGDFFLREPWGFPEPDAQVLVIVQNLETAQNTLQVVLYGQVLRFNEPIGIGDFPGGPITAARGDL